MNHIGRLRKLLLLKFHGHWASTKEVSEWIELRDKGDEAWLSASPALKEAVNICDRLLREKIVSV